MQGKTLCGERKENSMADTNEKLPSEDSQRLATRYFLFKRKAKRKLMANVGNLMGFYLYPTLSFRIFVSTAVPFLRVLFWNSHGEAEVEENPKGKSTSWKMSSSPINLLPSHVTFSFSFQPKAKKTNVTWEGRFGEHIFYTNQARGRLAHK